MGIVGDVLIDVGAATAGVGLVLLLTELLGSPDAPAAEAARIRPWAAGPVTGIEVVF